MTAFTNMSCAIIASAVAVLILSAIALQEIQANWGSQLEHSDERARIIDQELRDAIGGAAQLSADEQRANAIVMGYKLKELDEGFANLSHYNPSQHFFERKREIEKSPIFNIIRMMPKAGVLHVHDTAMLGKDFLLYNVTYMDDLYICIAEDGSPMLHFFKSPPQNPECTWNLLKDVRNQAANVQDFDKELGRYFTLEVDNPREVYKNVDDVWNYFNKIFALITPMLTYMPVWEAYFHEALRQYHDDGIFYVEVRSTLPDLYDLDGNTYGPMDTVRIYKTVNDKFVQEHPESFGSRIIYAPFRRVPNEEVEKYVETVTQLKSEFGDFLAGFDLVGQEDSGRPLIDLIPELLTLPSDIDVFYHAGETNWYGSTDYNLIDAVLLGAKRIGHGYALLKHPVIAKMVKEQGIAIEVNPLSNQVLMLVEDMRNHPASVMIANNYPVIISSDDPGLWGGLPLSHDLYMAFMGLSSRDADIKLLKQFTINSIVYSSMRPEEKVLALSKHEQRWDKFISDLIQLRK